MSFTNPDFNEPLLQAARKGDRAEIIRCLDAHADIECIEAKSGSRPLHFAAMSGSVEAVIVLLNRNAQMFVSDSYGRSALHLAAWKNKLTVVTSILERGADVNAVNKGGDTPLHEAAEFGHADIVQELLSFGADTEQTSWDGTPLCKAAREGHVVVVKILVDAGANLDTVDRNGNTTPLLLATFAGHAEIVDILLEKGTNTEYADNEGWTALHIASRKGDIRIASALVQIGGADLEVKNKSGSTPLMLAASAGLQDLVQFFVEHGASVIASDYERNRPLHFAAAKGFADIVRILLEAPLLPSPLLPRPTAGGGGVAGGSDRDRVVSDRFKNTSSGNSDKKSIKISSDHGSYKDKVKDNSNMSNRGNSMSVKSTRTPPRSTTPPRPITTPRPITPPRSGIIFQGGYAKSYRGINHNLDNSSRANNTNSVKISNRTKLTSSMKSISFKSIITTSELRRQTSALKPTDNKNNNTGTTAINNDINFNINIKDPFVNYTEMSPLVAIIKARLPDPSRVHSKNTLLIADQIGGAVNFINTAGYTALHMAAAFGQDQVVSLLLEKGAQIDSQDHFGYTPLHRAAEKGHLTTVRLLVTHGEGEGEGQDLNQEQYQDPSRGQGSGQYPDQRERKGQCKGADVNCVANDGVTTPYDIAYKHSGVQKYLLEVMNAQQN